MTMIQSNCWSPSLQECNCLNWFKALKKTTCSFNKSKFTHPANFSLVLIAWQTSYRSILKQNLGPFMLRSKTLTATVFKWWKRMAAKIQLKISKVIITLIIIWLTFSEINLRAKISTHQLGAFAMKDSLPSRMKLLSSKI